MGVSATRSQNVQFMAEKVQSAAERFLKDYVMETENTELNGFHFFLLNYDAEDRMQIRRQMKALLSEIRVQGDILKNLSVTLALGEGVGSLPEIGSSLKNARLLIEERLLAGTGKLMEGKIESGESFADSEIFAKFNDRIAHTLESLDSFAVREELIYLKTKMLAEKEISGHEILQMTKEICNQYLFFMKKYRLPVEENFMENFSVSADNCADAAELFDYLTRRITTSYENGGEIKETGRKPSDPRGEKVCGRTFWRAADAGRTQSGCGSLPDVPQHDL